MQLTKEEQDILQGKEDKTLSKVMQSVCSLMYMNDPLSAKKPIITNSNKLRTYSTARFFQDTQILDIIVRGHL
jgi:hypothetical protein